jgi:hypothetical protein
MTRNEMIQALTDNMVDSLRSDYRYCQDIVMSGFTGYSNYTNEELEQEYNEYIDDENVYIELDDISHINE